MSRLLAALAAIAALLAFVAARRSFTETRPGFADDLARALNGETVDPGARWVVGGMMGSGKTTLAASLASICDVTHIEIDVVGSDEQIVARTETEASEGWVAEANPWQIPAAVWAKADVIVFLDFDNTVNYVRLLSRGMKRWRSAGLGLTAFRDHVERQAARDLCRLVYLYGSSNRAGWREHGIGGLDADTSGAAYITCVSPAEVRILLDHVSAIRART